jgi:hypothetical protein
MFNQPFYNAGYTIRSISDFIPFIKRNLKNKYPKVLLIALDQWMFNKNWDNLSNYDLRRNEWTKPFNKNASGSTLLNVWKDLFKGKYSLRIIQKNEKTKIGLNAIVNNKGFRKDGSILYGDQIIKLINHDSTAKDFNYSDTYSRIDNGIRKFQYGNQLNSKSLVVLNNLLNYCKKNNMFVVAILPPFADKVNRKMQESKKYKYMDSIFIKSNELFTKYGFELWDMTDLNKYSSNDQETIDGFHGGEVSYIKMLIYMVENGSMLKDFTNLHKLKSNLSNKINDYTVYEN